MSNMIGYLRKYFSPDKTPSQFSLSIQYGAGGARLSHDHSTQFVYVAGK